MKHSKVALIRSLFILLVGCAAVQPDDSATTPMPAFPGAEGFGKFATGGRGGAVIVVTNLKDEGPGSLRHALRTKAPRIIVFAVSGNIELQSPLKIDYGNVTIAGQSAPGGGICLKNYPLGISADNVIIRFMRFRLGDEAGYEGDAISGNAGNDNIIVDHCSVSWGTDECASFYNNSNFTLQWSIISESLNNSIHSKGEHGYGGIWGGKGATFHHNLIASHNSRLPRFSGSASTANSPDELVDFRNNVIYNWMNNNIYGGERGRYNVVNNYFKPGPATKASKKGQILDPSEPYGKFFVEGNFLEGSASVSNDNHLGVSADDTGAWTAESAFAVEPVRTVAATAAYGEVLNSAGASFSRDGVDARIVEEVRQGNSSAGKDGNGIIDSQDDVGGWPALEMSTPPADADSDGMPDVWEKEKHLDPNNPADASVNTLDATYTNVEVYLHERVKDIVIASQS